MTLKEATKAIDPNRTYSLTETVRKGLIPFIKSYHTAYKAVLEDKAVDESERTLDAQIIGDGRARTIRIKGENLIAYIKANKDRLEE